MTNDTRRHVLIDTNVLVDAVDLREQSRATLAAWVIYFVIAAGALSTTTQVLAEFYDVTTRPKGGRPPIFSRARAAASVSDFLAVGRCLAVTSVVVHDAARIAARHRVRIYDAQLYASARADGISTILSADRPFGPQIEGVRYLDPFAESFSLDDLGV